MTKQIESLNPGSTIKITGLPSGDSTRSVRALTNIFANPELSIGITGKLEYIIEK